MNRPAARTIAVAAAVAAAIAATTWAGLWLSISDGIVAPVWVPAGIALAALTMRDLRLWPAVFVGTLAGNLAGDSALWLATGIAAVNSAQAVFGAWMLRRANFDPALARVRDIVRLVPAAIFASLIGATGGVVLLGIGGYVSAVTFLERWLLWWSGDIAGMLLAAPLLFAIWSGIRRGARMSPLRAFEFVVVHAALAAVAWAVFAAPEVRFPAVIFPFWAWTTVRFRALGSTTSSAVIAAMGITAALTSSSLAGDLTPASAVQILQALVALVGICALVIGATLSESDALRASAEDSAARLRNIDEAKDRLLAAVSHELRTPLTSIRAIADLALERHPDLPPAKLEEMLTLLSSESQRLDNLLTDLLDLERLRLGLVEPNYEPVDVPALVRATLARHDTAERHARLDAQDGVSIDADAVKLERIVDNLVSNAYKHSPSDGRVTVKVRRCDSGALIVVDDEGPGVPDSHKVAVFDAFNRGTSPLSEVPGTGIGLSLVHHFTELHGGRAWVEDRDGGGASFHVYLPGSRTSAKLDA